MCVFCTQHMHFLAPFQCIWIAQSDVLSSLNRHHHHYQIDLLLFRIYQSYSIVTYASPFTISVTHLLGLTPSSHKSIFNAGTTHAQILLIRACTSQINTNKLQGSTSEGITFAPFFFFKYPIRLNFPNSTTWNWLKDSYSPELWPDDPLTPELTTSYWLRFASTWHQKKIETVAQMCQAYSFWYLLVTKYFQVLLL